jgi:hypothetical protein
VREAVGDEPKVERGVQSAWGFTNAAKGFDELAQEVGPRGRELVTTLGIFDVYLGDDIGVE